MPGCASSSNRLGAAALALLLAAAGPAEVPELDARLVLLAREDARVATIFHRLAVAAAPFCRARAAQPGLLLHRLDGYAPGARAAAARLFGLRDAVTIAAVAERGAAWRVGLRPGDAIVALDGVAPPPGTAGVIATYDGLARAPQLRVERAGVRREVRLEREMGCDARVQLRPSSRLDAHGDGRRIEVTTALVETAASDDELAFLLAHELAHVATPSIPGRAAELAADRLGRCIMLAAGFDPAAAATALTRVTRARGPRIDPMHPALGKRLAGLRSAVSSPCDAASPAC